MLRFVSFRIIFALYNPCSNPRDETIATQETNALLFSSYRCDSARTTACRPALRAAVRCVRLCVLYGCRFGSGSATANGAATACTERNDQ